MKEIPKKHHLSGVGGHIYSVAAVADQFKVLDFSLQSVDIF